MEEDSIVLVLNEEPKNFTDQTSSFKRPSALVCCAHVCGSLMAHRSAGHVSTLVRVFGWRTVWARKFNASCFLYQLCAHWSSCRDHMTFDPHKGNHRGDEESTRRRWSCAWRHRVGPYGNSPSLSAKSTIRQTQPDGHWHVINVKNKGRRPLNHKRVFKTEKERKRWERAALTPAASCSFSAPLRIKPLTLTVIMPCSAHEFLAQHQKITIIISQRSLRKARVFKKHPLCAGTKTDPEKNGRTRRVWEHKGHSVRTGAQWSDGNTAAELSAPWLSAPSRAAKIKPSVRVWRPAAESPDSPEEEATSEP